MDVNGAAVGLTQPQNAFEGGCLTRAVRSQQSEDLPDPDFETDAANRYCVVVTFPQPDDGNRRSRRSLALVIRAHIEPNTADGPALACAWPPITIARQAEEPRMGTTLPET